MPSRLPQLLLTATASLGYLTIGLLRGWTSPAMPSMLQTHPHLVPTETVVSWVCAVPALSAFFGSLLTGPFLHQFGRKKTLMLAAPTFAIAWITMGAAVNTTMLIVGRILTGIAAGIIIPSAQVYVSECAHPDIRGILGSLPALFMACGVLIAYVMGAWLPWNYLTFVCAAFPALMFLFLFPLPESPSWLESRGRSEKARKHSKWLRHEDSVQLSPRKIPNGESTQVSMTLVQNENKPEVFSAIDSEKGALLNSFLQRPVLVPFGMVAAILIFQQISGIDTVLFYTVAIFNASGSSVNDYLATVLVGIAQVLATIVSLFIVDKYGRKPLLIFSGSFMAISMSALSYYFYAHNRHLPIEKSLGLLPVISLMVFIAAFALGYCNVPFLLMGELLPAGQRSVLSSIASAFNLGTMFIVIKTYPDIKHWIGDEGAFGAYAVVCALSCIFVMFFLPETKGRSLEEIETYFKSKAESRRKRYSEN